MVSHKENEHWLRSVLFYIPRLIATALSAFTADDKGWSLKKVLAAYATYVAAESTKTKLEANNVIILVLIWLVYAGILVGIYSISDISNAVSKYKGNPTPEPEKK